MSKVAVLKTQPDTVIEDYKRLLDLAEFERHIPKDKPVILKDNISWHFLFPGANTTPWQLEAVIQYLLDHGYTDISAVHNKTVVIDAPKGQRLNRLDVVYRKYGIPELHNYDPAHMKWIVYKPKAKMLALDAIYPEGFRIPDYFVGKSIIHLPTVKCHIYTTMTGAMKNAFGGLLNTKRHYTHSVIHATLCDLLAVQQEIHPGIFAVMDGTTCGNGPGPRCMAPERKDYILASADSVAIDCVSTHLMGLDPAKVKCVWKAGQLGLGCGKFDDIDVVGEDISDVNFGFDVGATFASRVGHLVWFGPLRRLQKLFFHTPIVYIFVLGSYLYHDYFWYPLKGKPILREWLTTPWGQRFESYGAAEWAGEPGPAGKDTTPR
ncbi:MAG: DUF362 domain-containing protein [Candidatus Hydrogenedentes bacterium]|nr:DUF362 domain-containing protein [Candidatus Hydrogenedentota bacterium]